MSIYLQNKNRLLSNIINHNKYHNTYIILYTYLLFFFKERCIIYNCFFVVERFPPFLFYFNLI